MPVNLSINKAHDRTVMQDDRHATPADIVSEVRRLRLQTPAEAAAMVRADRDGRSARGRMRRIENSVN
jgi:hypothetical protein